MVKIELRKIGFIIRDDPEKMEIIIPNVGRYSANLFYGIYLALWIFGGISEIGAFLNTDSKESILSMTVLLGGWTLVGGVVIIFWLWESCGREIIRIDDFELQHKKDFILFSYSKKYNIAHVKCLRVTALDTSGLGDSRRVQYWFNGRKKTAEEPDSVIAFDYDRNTPSFGSGLEVAEAKHIIEKIKSRYKNL